MRKKCASHATKLCRDESGASLLEYSLLLGLISVIVIIVAGGIVPWLTSRWAALQTALGISGNS